MVKPLHYDLIIVGGGLVGASLALALRDLHLKVALIDARMPSSEDARLFGLNINSIAFLNHLGVWPDIRDYASPIHAVHVSCEGAFGALRLRDHEAGWDMLGQVVPAFRLETALNEALLDLPYLTVYRPAQLVDLETLQDSTILQVKQGETTLALSAPVILGADGTESTLRDLLHIPTETNDYHQTAIVTHFELGRPHQGIAYERFCRAGTLAMLPLPNQQCASILSADTQAAEQYLALSDDDYLAYCQSLIGYRLGRLHAVGKRAAYPLRMKRALQATAGHVFLLGNALHTLHPVAAQGLNLALFEVAMLVECFSELKRDEKALTIAALRAVSERIQEQQRVSMTVSDRLARLFSKPLPGISFLAGLGMAGFDSLPLLKKQFITLMVGRAGVTPSFSE